MKKARGTTLVAVTLLASCSSEEAANTATPDVPHDVLEVEQTIGSPGEMQPEYEFGRISGLTILPDGRVAMTDAMHHEVRVFRQDGTHAFTFGRNGAGPGELDSPCCLAVDRNGWLWVRDGGNARYNRYTIANDSATFDGQIRMAHGDANRWAPITFDAAGNVIDIGTRTVPPPVDRATFRLHLDSAGAVVDETQVHRVPTDSIGMKEVKSADGAITFFGYQPFGPSELVAHSPTGEFAHALSSRYAIDWRAADGTLIRTIARDIDQGPPLSAAERATGEERLRQLANRMRISVTQLGLDVPSDKTPLRSLFFDRTGRLWVELEVAEGADRIAHVFGVDGAHERTVTWPADVNLASGAIRDDLVWGLSRDSLDTPLLVRLRGHGTRK